MLYNVVMIRETPLIEGEIYHVYNRGAHKQEVFTNDSDYRRFQLLMHLANSSEPVHMGNLLEKYKGRSFMEIFVGEKTDKFLVDILAYCLMPNHFHLVLKQKKNGGITKFMNKVGTGYSMYFNTKYDHSGVLFQGRFKSRHVDTDEYLRYLFAYVHLNPVDLIQSDWKDNGIKEPKKVQKFMDNYRFSSHMDYSVSDRPERALLAYESAREYLQGQNDLKDLLRSYREYKGPASLGE